MLEDGIYFGLPQEEYHALQRLSGSGCQNLLVSPATFWADSWLNPARMEKEELEQKAEALILGSAYHSAKLEPEIFAYTYRRGLNLADFGDDMLTSHEQIKAKLKELGHPQTVAGEKVLDAARRLRDAGYTKPIKHLVEDEFARSIEEGEIVLHWRSYDQVVADAAAVRLNPEISQFLAEGASEVTILWTDDKGVKWKARIDRLQVKRIVDLKTFENPRRKILEQVLYDAIAYNRLYIQAFVYWTACELIRASKLSIRKVQTKEQKALIEAIRQNPDPFEYWWVFQEKKGVPNVLARRLRMTEEPHPSHLVNAPDEKSREELRRKMQSPSMIWSKAKLEVEHARNLFLQCAEIWPTGPWGAMVPIADIDDEGFNSFWLQR